MKAGGKLKIIVALLIFGFIVLIHELGHFIAAVKNGILVEEFAIGMGPKIFSKKKGETIYSIRILPFGGFCKMLGEDEAVDNERAFSSKSVWQRMVVVVAGATFNILLAFIFAIIFITSAGTITTTIDEVSPDSPAELAGLQPGDKITKIDDHTIISYKEISFYIVQKQGQAVTVTYERNGIKDQKMIKPEISEGSYRIGITGVPINKSNFFEIIKYSFLEIIFWIKMVIISLGMLIGGNVTRQDIAGPVGMLAFISEGYAESVKYGFTQVLQTLCFYIILLSSNLGVVNLLPIPALDGGRLIFLFIEAIRGKPLNQEKESFVHFVGFVMLMGLMVFLLFNDISNLF